MKDERWLGSTFTVCLHPNLKDKSNCLITFGKHRQIVQWQRNPFTSHLQQCDDDVLALDYIDKRLEERQEEGLYTTTLEGEQERKRQGSYTTINTPNLI